MRADSVLRLARADLSLGRGPALAYATAALVGVALTRVPDPAVRGLGVSLLLGTLIGQCFHLPIVFVFQDALRGTRAFTLSLPVTPAEYAAGKLLASATLFLVPAGAAALAMALTPAPDRLFSVPLVLLMLQGWLIFFVQNLGLAMITESMGVTIAVLLAEIFLVGNGGMVIAPRLPGMLRAWGQLEAGGPIRTFAFLLFAAQLVLLVPTIFFFMNRKRSFV